MILDLVDEATAAGARLSRACEVVGIDSRTLARWRKRPCGGEDGRHGPLTPPANKLSAGEVAEIERVMNLPQHRDLPPSQIVPRLADQGIYLASESTMYRILRRAGQLVHRSAAKPPVRRRPNEYTATGPNQILTWDVTYMKASIRGQFHYLYMVEDVWSRKIVGYAVHDRESADLAAELVHRIVAELGIDPRGVVLHSDNGGPMKGATMLATLKRLGIVPSFSRPSVSDDNPYIESLFRTMKYRPEYPFGAFESIEDARRWVELFVRWYNTEHLHSGLNFVTPDQRHHGEEHEVLRNRRKVYAAARRRRPERWARETRNWEPRGDVVLNPAKANSGDGEEVAAA